MFNFNAASLQKKLLEKGFVGIIYCDVQDDGWVSINHYSLTKEGKPSEEDPSCTMYTWIDLGSQEALGILENWMNQYAINPDPRSF